MVNDKIFKSVAIDLVMYSKFIFSMFSLVNLRTWVNNFRTIFYVFPPGTSSQQTTCSSSIQPVSSDGIELLMQTMPLTWFELGTT